MLLGRRRPRRASRIALICAIGALASAASLGAARGSAGSPADRGRSAQGRPRLVGDTGPLVDQVCALPSDQLQRIRAGFRLDLGGDIQLVPRQPNFVSAGISHAGPWDYLQQIPMLWYGPGFIRPGAYGEGSTLADVAPTEAALLKFSFAAPDGQPLAAALRPAPRRPLPRLVVTLVWDGAGLDVLRAWPSDWPNLRSLEDAGASFPRATVGSSPSNTPPSHATIGTGAFPARNGVVDEYVRYGSTMAKPFDRGPGALLSPTLGDVYDRAKGNRPIVGTVATLGAHLAMMSHGSLWGGSDRDIAVAREKPSVKGGAEGTRWNLPAAMAPYYRFPAYVNAVPGFPADQTALDRQDGRLDGRWMDNSIQQYNHGFDTPARIPYETRVIEDVVRREGFGRDPTPDLLYLNYKAIDAIGHIFTLNSPEMRDAIRAQDIALADLIRFLNADVGRRQWVMVVLADHGHQYDPAVSGAFEIGTDQIAQAVADRFDDADATPLVQWIRPTEMWIDHAELRQSGATLADVAAFVGRLTEADTRKPGEHMAQGEAGAPVFAAAFPSAMLADPALCS
jgi:Type I phosphodiesterase / nucleotide pyrophosphatase